MKMFLTKKCQFCLNRKIRHPYVVNLMAVLFEPFNRVGLVLEPTKCTLHHFLFEEVS